MAKDTEKLIRQLSLISYLMAERRPVTALEIRRDVEGYSGMNEDAFARRFYADRSELESLRIQLTVERPTDGAAEQENYSLRPENFHLPPIAFSDTELAALQTALSLLDGEFAYAEPLRLALQQITWGRPSPLRAPEQRSVALGITASAGGHELSARLAKVETAIFRNKTITFDYYTMQRDETGPRRVDPYHLLFQGGQFYLLGTRTSARRSACSGSRASAARSPTQPRPSTTFAAPMISTRAPMRAGRTGSSASRWALPTCSYPSGSRGRCSATSAVTERSQVAGDGARWMRAAMAWTPRERRRARSDLEGVEAGEGDIVFATGYSSPRTILAWVLGLRRERAAARPGVADGRAGPASGAAVGAPRRGLSRRRDAGRGGRPENEHRWRRRAARSKIGRGANAGPPGPAADAAAPRARTARRDRLARAGKRPRSGPSDSRGW